MTVPLYNCYWCKCAYCDRMLKDPRCKLSDCLRCIERDKKTMIPLLRRECSGFIEKEVEPLQVREATAEMCSVCKWRKMAAEIRKWYFETND